ncbi:substrate-binding domain-containing protein [Chroococcidiopsis sp. FACHB-1243]|uniref:substrate-binding domain-containing protein n=1 Tax=Chroococcidiopsis sp. [FACHB-1243] TaxID=2692781 RepID=UPI00177BE4D9|nr:substrate-binding domain-containing protein [Chroococcidiopsis sp. [FACHB-1243]]MBD2308741.1 substrate-binding domain-containing protein [Chroococcidiopsis sp. [FACHB-1243]]
MPTDPYARSYRCWQNAPLSCDRPLKTAQEVPNAKFCLECGFPATLPNQAEIRGSRDVYRILEFVRSQGMGRLYKGVQVSDGQPVVIKEYLLPSRYFNAEEAEQRKAKFTQIAGMSPVNDRSPDFRSILPWEAIADRQGDRCHLVTLGNIAAAPNLSQVLQQNGAMPPERVRDLLAQVLQTLQFLHAQKFRLPSGQVRGGMAHGNLSLESLIATENSYIYTCDLAAWERLFDPPPNTFPIPEPAQDLVALGHIAFYLGLGRAKEPTSERSPDLRNVQLWSKTDPALREFLYHLIGLETPFSSAEAARQALLQLPNPKTTTTTAPRTLEGKSFGRRRLLWLLGLPLLLFLGGLLWLVRSQFNREEEANFAEFQRLVPSFNDLNTIQAGKYPYTAERDSTWTTVVGKRPLSDRSLNDILTRPRMDIAASFIHTKPKSSGSPLKTVTEQNNQANFAITSLIDNLPPALNSEQIAYDGLLVFVPAYKAQNLPAALQGEISLDDLQKIFTGQVKNWQELNPNLPNLTIKPYRPLEPEALKLFAQIVLKDDPQLIAKFNQIKQRSTFQTLRAIDFAEEQGQQLEAGTISFGTLVQTWDQCKVYPLALVQGNAKPVQALLRETTDNKLVPITEDDNLCQEKKPFPNVEAYRQRTYPLGFPLAIVYPNDNSLLGFKSAPMFADLLKTRDGQFLLQQTGLVPLQPIPRDYQPSASLP